MAQIAATLGLYVVDMDRPDFLDADQDAAAEWDRLAPLLVSRGLVDEPDANLLGLYCLTWAKLQRQWRVLESEGDVIFQGADRMTVSPRFDVCEKLAGRVIRISNMLGLSPGGRAEIGSNDDRDAELERFVASLSS